MTQSQKKINNFPFMNSRVMISNQDHKRVLKVPIKKEKRPKNKRNFNQDLQRRKDIKISLMSLKNSGRYFNLYNNTNKNPNKNILAYHYC